MRLLPLYWLLAGISLFIAIIYFYKNEHNILFFDFINFPPNASVPSILYIVISNIIIWGQDLAMFLGISSETGNLFFSSLSFAEEYPAIRFMLLPVAWSISTEFSFYLIAPFILRNRKRVVFFLFILSLFSNFITNYYNLNNSNWRFRFFPSTLVFFITGYYAYLIYIHIKKMYFTKKYKSGCVFFLISLIVVFFNLNLSYAVNCAFLLFIIFLFLPYLFYAFKDEKIDRIIGEMSYPLYLVHPIIIGVADLLEIDNKMFTVFASVLGAYLCYKCFVLPLEKIRNKYK